MLITPPPNMVITPQLFTYTKEMVGQDCFSLPLRTVNIGRKVQQLGKYACLLSFRELDKKIDATLMTVCSI